MIEYCKFIFIRWVPIVAVFVSIIQPNNFSEVSRCAYVTREIMSKHQNIEIKSQRTSLYPFIYENWYLNETSLSPHIAIEQIYRMWCRTTLAFFWFLQVDCIETSCINWYKQVILNNNFIVHDDTDTTQGYVVPRLNWDHRYENHTVVIMIWLIHISNDMDLSLLRRFFLSSNTGKTFAELDCIYE